VALARTTSTLKAFERRKASFQVIKKGGLFSRDDLVCEAHVELAPLLAHCDLAVEAPMVKEGSRRALGGHLQVGWWTISALVRHT
jgi:hypothetical protein